MTSSYTRGSIKPLVWALVFSALASCAKNARAKKPDALAGKFFFQSFSLFLKPMKLKAAMELVILRCGYSRQPVHSIFFAIGILTLVT